MLWAIVRAMVHSVGNSTNCWMVLETTGSIRGIRIIGRMLDEGFVRWMYRSICRWRRGRSQRGRGNGEQIVITIAIKPSHHHTITHIMIIIISVLVIIIVVIIIISVSVIVLTILFCSRSGRRSQRAGAWPSRCLAPGLLIQ